MLYILPRKVQRKILVKVRIFFVSAGIAKCYLLNCRRLYNYWNSVFIAHLSWKPKWAFLITCRPSSVRPSVCLSVNFSHFHLLQNHWANFNQTWHKVSLCEGDSSLFKRRAPPFSKGRKLGNKKNKLTTVKNLLLQNHWANFNQTWHKASLDEGDSSLFKWRTNKLS